MRRTCLDGESPGDGERGLASARRVGVASMTAPPHVSETPAAGPPAHIEETIQAIGRFNAEHLANATQHQRIVDRLTALLGRPVFLVTLTAVVLAWAGSNYAAAALGLRPLDPPPFPMLTGAASLVSLYFVALVLTTQRRSDRLTLRRESLNMELAILNAQMSAKTIALLEELRRDTPIVRDRVDALADGMARPADAQSVIEAIQETRSEA